MVKHDWYWLPTDINGLSSCIDIPMVAEIGWMNIGTYNRFAAFLPGSSPKVAAYPYADAYQGFPVELYRNSSVVLCATNTASRQGHKKGLDISQLLSIATADNHPTGPRQNNIK